MDFAMEEPATVLKKCILLNKHNPLIITDIA